MVCAAASRDAVAFFLPSQAYRVVRLRYVSRRRLTVRYGVGDFVFLCKKPQRCSAFRRTNGLGVATTISVSGLRVRNESLNTSSVW